MNVIMNLNGLILCPFQGVLDLAEQLTTDTESVLIQRIFQPVYELNTINDWVNVDDSLGDLSVIRAKELTDLLCSKLNRRNLEIHINLGDASLTVDNFYTLLFLSEAMDKLEVFFYVSPKKIQELQKLTKTLQEKETIFLHYRHEECFSTQPVFVEKSNKLSIKRHQILSEHGFAFEETSAEKVTDSSLSSLIAYAWSCLKAGAYPLGCRLFEALLPQKEGVIGEELFVHLQIIRFLSHQHHLVVEASFPETFRFVKQERITHLYFIKAFSATLIRNLPVAELYFEKAGISDSMPMTDEDSIYKLNLYALFHLLKGNTDTAFQLEIKIQQYIQLHHINATALHHVVFMNIARLYKKLKQYKLAADNYEKAYDQLSSGGFTPFDHMSCLMDQAILDEARGRMREALFSWIKVGIHWLSCPNPYALAVRPRLVLCQEKVVDTLAPLSKEKVTRFLLEKINFLSVIANMTNDNSSRPIFNFVSDEAKSISKNGCYVENNLLLYSCSLSTEQPNVRRSSAEQALYRVISQLINNHTTINSNVQQTLTIETKHDCFYPQSKEQSLALALLSGCTLCSYNGEEIPLNQWPSYDRLHNIQATLSKMILSIEPTTKGLRIVYKRSFLNKLIESAEEIALINKLQKHIHINFSLFNKESNNDQFAIFLSLFSKKIVTFSSSQFTLKAGETSLI